MCFSSAHNLKHQGYWQLIELVLYRFLATVAQLAREKYSCLWERRVVTEEQVTATGKTFNFSSIFRIKDQIFFH